MSLQQASDERHVHLAAERERAGNRLAGSRARCDEENVVVKARVATRPDLVGVRVDGREAPAPMRGAAAPCQARQIEAEHLAHAEGLADGEGPVVEVEIRRDELDVDELAGRLPQGHHRFESGDAAPGDQNELFPTSGHPFRVGDCVPSGIGAGAEAAAGKPQVQSGRPPMQFGPPRTILRSRCFDGAMQFSGAKATAPCAPGSSCSAPRAYASRPARVEPVPPRWCSATPSSRQSAAPLRLTVFALDRRPSSSGARGIGSRSPLSTASAPLREIVERLAAQPTFRIER